MKKLKVFFVLLVVMFVFVFTSCNKKEENNKTTTSNINISVFTFDDLKNILHNKKDNKKKIVLINFWATWCPSCRKEIPDLIQFYDEFKDKVVLLGLSLDESKDELVKFIQLAKINFPVYIADKELAQHLMVQTIPVTYVFKNGKFLYRHIGDYSYSQLKADINELLK